MHQPLLLNQGNRLKLSRTGWVRERHPGPGWEGWPLPFPPTSSPSLPSPPLWGGGSGNWLGRGKEARAALVAEVVAEPWFLAWSVCSPVGLSRHGCAGALSVDPIAAAVAPAASGW